MRGPTPERLKAFLCRQFSLDSYLHAPGDGRKQPQIPAETLLWSQLIGQLLREASFLAVERLVHSSARQALGVAGTFGDDALAYFTERLDPQKTRQALVSVLLKTKRNKAFDNSRFIGFALDGTGAGRSSKARCAFCRPLYNQDHHLVGYLHAFSMISVVGTGLSLPFDVEPYASGDSEYAASQRLLKRAVASVGRRFAQYVVVDGVYATAPFIETVRDCGLRVIARLKANLPELFLAAQRRFRSRPASTTLQARKDRVEIWDADDFQPWETLSWQSVRVIYYRQHKPDGTTVEAYWLTDFPSSQVGSRALYAMAKSRWEIENQGFNEGKNHHDMEHICHHHPNSMLIQWLLAAFALTLERLYRLRYLRRGSHRPHTPIEFLLFLRLSLATPYHDTS